MEHDEQTHSTTVRGQARRERHWSPQHRRTQLCFMLHGWPAVRVGFEQGQTACHHYAVP